MILHIPGVVELRRWVIRMPLLCACVVLLSHTSYSQQLPQFTQFRDLLSYHNPAATGAFGIQAALAGRYQWMGLEDSLGNHLGPETLMLFADIPLNNEKNGLGMMGFYDAIGWEKSVFVRLNAAHHISIGHNSLISLGLAADFQQRSYDFSIPAAIPGQVPGFMPTGIEKAATFDLGAGVLYSHTSGLFAGFSAQNILQSPLKYDGFTYRNMRQYQFISGATIAIYDQKRFTLDFMPAILLKSLANFVPQYDVQAGVLLNKRLYAGMIYRHEDAVGLHASMVFNFLRIGVSYDYTIGGLAQAGSLASPEVVISYVRPLIEKSRMPGRCYGW